MHFERLYVCMGQVNVYKELRRSWKGLELGVHDIHIHTTLGADTYLSATKVPRCFCQHIHQYSQGRDRHKCRHLFECFSRQDTEHVSTVSLSELNIYNILNVWQVSFLFETQTFSKWKYTNFEKSGKTLKRLRWVSQIYVIHIILLFIWIMCYKFVCDNKL